MNRVYKVLFILLMIFFMNAAVRADYKCYYSYTSNSGASGGTKNVSGSIKVNTSKKTFEYELFGDDIPLDSLDPYINSEWTEERLVDELDGKCPKKVYMCQGSRRRGGNHKGTGTKIKKRWIIINNTLKSKFIEQLDSEGRFYILNVRYSFNKETPCHAAKIDESKTKVRTKTFTWPCEEYITLKEGMEKNYCNIGDNNCNLEKIQNYKKYKDQIKSYCNIVVQNSDEFEGCMQSCLNLQDEIFELEGTSSNENTCGFSDRLINWIINIMNWIKYILPVIVIILGIIDFIKAMATEKDDEMKKAQKKFVIRLISAALVFIIPFIIVFVLEKMGFSAESCGLF